MSTLRLTQANHSQSFIVRIGDEIIIQLAENPTTGYRWAVEPTAVPILTLEHSRFTPSGTNPGTSGQRTLTFKAQQAGTAQLQFKLWQQWEGERSITDRFSVTIQV